MMMNLLAISQSQWPIWLHALSSDIAIKAYCILAISLLVIGLIVLYLRRVNLEIGTQSFIRNPKDIARDEGGSTMIQFVLILPIFLFFLIAIGQTMILLVGNLYVHYAAYSATRAAVVIIPQDQSEKYNIMNGINGEKHQFIEEAAYLALVPVSGQSDTPPAGMSSDEYQTAIQSYYSAYGQSPPHWSTRLPARQLNYAANNTDVTVYIVRDSLLNDLEQVQGQTSFDQNDPVMVDILFQMPIAMPYVSHIFKDGDNSDGYQFTNLRAHYVMHLDGIPDEMPPEPDVPRRDP